MQENSKYGKCYILGRLDDGSFIFFNWNDNVDIESSFRNHATKDKIEEKNKRKFFFKIVEMFRNILKKEDFLHKSQIKRRNNNETSNNN
ncbi:MAG: hypothetical protein V1663_04150 [archaeon]